MCRLGVVRVPSVFILFECRRSEHLEQCGESGVEATSCRWVFFVEFGDLLGSVFTARCWFPSVITVAVPFPLDQILKFLVIDA